MDIVIAGRSVTFNIALKDGAGASVTAPDTCSWSLYDGANAVINGPNSVVVGGSVLSVTPPTTISGTDLRAYRKIEVTFEKAGVTNVVDYEFILEQPIILEAGLNSFQDYPDAVITAMEISDIDAFQLADKSQKQTALITAFHSLSTLNFYINGVTYGQIDQLSKTEFEALPDRFKKTIKKAQIVEANENLSTNSAHRKRQLGIFSETIGESSMFFRTGKPIPLPVTRRALDILRGYIVWEMGVGRA